MIVTPENVSSCVRLLLRGKLFILHKSVKTQSGIILEDQFGGRCLTRESMLPIQLGCKGSGVTSGRGQAHNPNCVQ